MAHPEFETVRLRLRQLRPDDLAPHRAAVDDDAAVTWAHERLPLTASLRRWADRLDEWDREGYGMWIVEVQESGQVIGHCGLQRLEQGDEVELGYYLGRAGWGNGYATEAAAAALTYGFDRCALSRIVAVVRHDNTASQNVLGKLGMRHVKDDHFYGVDAVLYAIDRP